MIADQARNLVPNDRRVTALPGAHRARHCGSPRATRDDQIPRHHRQDLREHGEAGQLAQRHANLDYDILDRRAVLYETARQRNPLRCKGPTCNWKRIRAVHLNPDRADVDTVIPQPRYQERKAA